MLHSPQSLLLPPDAQQVARNALEYRKGGRPAEAVALIRQLLARFPRHPDLLGQLAASLMQLGDFQAALPCLEQARAAAPGNAQHWLMLTQCLLELDRAKDADKVISAAIRQGLRHPQADELLRRARSGNKKKLQKAKPLNEVVRELDTLFQARRYAELERLAHDATRRHAKSAQISYLLGMAILAQGRPQEAISPLRRAAELDPAMAPAWFNLGFAQEGLGRLDEALDAYRRSVAAAPQLADAHNNLGNVLQKLKRHGEALAAYDRALALRQEPGFHMNRGDALRDLERLEEAVAAYEAALELKPDLVEAQVNLALALYMLERYEETLRILQRAISLRPDSFGAYQALGHALRRLKRNEEAVGVCRRAVELRPEDAEAHKDLGMALKDLSRHEEAIASLRRALALRPDFDIVFNLLADTLLAARRHDEALETYRQGLALDPQGLFATHSNLLFALNYQSGATPEAMLAEARLFGEKAACKAVPFSHHDNSPDPDRRLRIGLVSGDLGKHPVGYFLLNVLENLDPAKVELFAYATEDRKDEFNQRLRRSIPHWREARVSKIADEALATEIRADGIDILIDLAGHTAKNRLPVFAWKPAPVQATWLGYLGTTGLEAMDYVLADRCALPEGEEGQFTETPWCLPETYICFSPPDVAAEVGPLAAKEKGYVTFGCFNNLNKVSEQVVGCWSRVLRAVPDARMYLKAKELDVAEVRTEIAASFARFGIDPERLILAGRLDSHEAHFRAYQQIDIALDPFPYPGITTTVEALWMGVPVLSLKGSRFISHQGETILHNVGLQEWIAVDEDDYVAKAAAFAEDAEALSGLRVTLRERLLASPLCDAPRFARNLETAFRGMWQKWCERQKLREG